MLDESSFPMMYYCQHGKDRTGLVSTFLLWSLGLPRDKIIAEYHQSELNLSVIQETVHSDFQSIGAIEEFEKTPAEVLEASLDYIESKYKGISNYLRLCGISITLQNRLKAIFLEKVDPMVLAFPS
mmetsp:Transcript_37090/g.51168  ORF Transcript_37090/g.51168 Transcript_37090/m.51168 type:complete len:126 (+) Transcript_37090:233-610(+)